MLCYITEERNLYTIPNTLNRSHVFMTCTKQIFSLPQIGYPSMDERERREINNTTMGYEEVRDNKDTREGPDGLGVGRDHD